jgi:hypothetical protein
MPRSGFDLLAKPRDGKTTLRIGGGIFYDWLEGGLRARVGV